MTSADARRDAQRARSGIRARLLSASGVIDLASVLIGSLIVSFLGGVIMVSVTVAIPWSQDAEATASVTHVRVAQSAAKVSERHYLGYAELTDSEFQMLQYSSRVTTGTGLQGRCFVTVAESDSGRIFFGTSRTAEVIELTENTPSSATDWCTDVDALVDGIGGTPVQALDQLMVTTWVTTPSCKTLTLPVGGATSGTIDWGDGGSVDELTGRPSHTFSNNGATTITIEGTFESWDGSSHWSSSCITSVLVWHGTETISAASGFASTSMTSFPEIPDTLADASRMFYKSPFIPSGVSDWNTTAVTDMSGMFHWTNIDQDLSGWDTANVTDMSEMFYRAADFNQDVSGWNTAKVTDMAGMFRKASSFTQNLSSWNVANVEGYKFFDKQSGMSSSDLPAFP